MRGFLQFESNIDPWLAALVFFVMMFSGLAGWAICQVTHKQRGIEVDRPVTDVLPMPPPPIVVEEQLYLPEDWQERV